MAPPVRATRARASSDQKSHRPTVKESARAPSRVSMSHYYENASQNQSSRIRTVGDFALGKTIGEGTFGKVKLGKHTISQEKVAIKILERSRMKEAADVVRVTREIKILKRNIHPNVIQLYEVLDSTTAIYLIMEHIDGGELFDYIVSHQRLQEPQACYFFHQVCDGLEYLHLMEVTHRDLKPENLLLQSSPKGWIVKIADFGLSNTHEGGRLLATACGSPCYAAPEMIAGKKYVGPKADMWSLGVVMYAMVCGYLPFEESTTAKLYQKILAGDYKSPSFISKDCRNLIRSILNTDPKRRYYVTDVRRHPWYNIIDMPANSIMQHSTSLPQPEDLEEDVMAHLASMGLERGRVSESVCSGTHDSHSTSYYLIQRKLRRHGRRVPLDSSQGISPSSMPSPNSSRASLGAASVAGNDHTLSTILGNMSLLASGANPPPGRQHSNGSAAGGSTGSSRRVQLALPLPITMRAGKEDDVRVAASVDPSAALKIPTLIPRPSTASGNRIRPAIVLGGHQAGAHQPTPVPSQPSSGNSEEPPDARAQNQIEIRRPSAIDALNPIRPPSGASSRAANRPQSRNRSSVSSSPHTMGNHVDTKDSAQKQLMLLSMQGGPAVPTGPVKPALTNGTIAHPASGASGTELAVSSSSQIRGGRKLVLYRPDLMKQHSNEPSTSRSRSPTHNGQEHFPVSTKSKGTVQHHFPPSTKNSGSGQHFPPSPKNKPNHNHHRGAAEGSTDLTFRPSGVAAGQFEHLNMTNGQPRKNVPTEVAT